MCDHLELEKADHRFRQFVRKYRASKARNTSIGDPDPPAKEPVNVDHKEAVECFIRNNPEFARFKERLVTETDEWEVFVFDKELWEDENTRMD